MNQDWTTVPGDQRDEDAPGQPANSKVQVERRGSGICLAVPAPGFWRGSMGLSVFAFLGCGFMAAITGDVLFSIISGKQSAGGLGAFLPFLAGGWAIGVGLLIVSVRLGRRTVTFTAESERLSLVTIGLFGTRQREWPAGDLAAIRVGLSIIQMNHRHLRELQIYLRTGRKVSVLAGREGDELRWMAAELRGVLKVPAEETRA
jgi:hypothetical protein